MNVGEWLALQAMSLLAFAYKRPSDSEDMVEIAPYQYVNRTAYDFGLGKANMARNAVGETIQNVPIGNSLTPWRVWLPNEHDGWIAKRSWR